MRCLIWICLLWLTGSGAYAQAPIVAVVSSLLTNDSPSVSITQPVPNTIAGVSSNVTVSAAASDGDGMVVQVDFYVGSTLIGTKTSAPYSITWSPAATGAYYLSALATDDLGNTTNSAVVVVNVTAGGTNQPPAVSLSANPVSAVAPANVTLTSTASDSDGSVAKVEFLQGGNVIATINAPNAFTYTASNLAAGSYSFTARATDNLDAVYTSPAVGVTLSRNQPPGVALTGPANNALFTPPAQITLTAMAADPDGTIASVQLLNGSSVITTLTSPPYTYNLTNVTAGSYMFSAKATDDKGAVSSAQINVTVLNDAKIYYIYTDHQNTPRAITNAAGTTVWKWDNDEPFGANAANQDPNNTGTQFVFNLRFPGQYYDSETGLHYNYYRDYDPSTGRYIQSDPKGLSGGINTYSYAFSNPPSYVDAEGASPTLVTGAIGAAIGGAVGAGIAWYTNGNIAQGFVTGAIAGGVAGLTLGVTGAAIARLSGGGISGGIASGVVASGAGNVASQGYGLATGNQECFSWSSFGVNVGLGAVFGGIALRPYTAPSQVVTSWAPAGVTPNLNPPRWVMTGDPSLRNWAFTATGYPPANSVTSVVPGSQLAWPPGAQSSLGFLGQRIYTGP